MKPSTTPSAAPDPTPEQAPAPPQVNLQDLGQVMGDAVARGIAANTRRKITFGEYVARGGNSPFHPDPQKKVKLTRVCFQNGHMIEHGTAFDRELELLNKITHSGRYIDRLVEVVVAQDGSEETVDIRFSNKSQFAFELKGRAKDFTAMLEQIVAAQAEERREQEEFQASRTASRRHFGDNKASRDARDAAGV